MPESSTIAGRVLDALVRSGRVSEDESVAAHADGITDAEAGRKLVAEGVVSADEIASAVEEELGVPSVDLASYAPDEAALSCVPAAVARERRVLPLFEIEGMLTVAIGEPADVFALDELAAEIGVEVEPVLAEEPQVAAAIRQYYAAEPEPQPEPAAAGPEPVGEPTPPSAPSAQPAEAEPLFFAGVPIEGATDEFEIATADFFEVGEDGPVVVDAPEAVRDELATEVPTTEFPAAETSTSEPQPEAAEAAPMPRTVEEVVAAAQGSSGGIDLDVLAVADERRLALLVADILEQAVARGANRIHLLPYKNDFFLVFRVQGRLEKITSAPLSMQTPLIEGFKNFAKLGQVPADRPALGRVHSEIGGKQLVLTVSSVPTVAGQRLVVSISAARTQPRSLVELGMNEAESRALQAMVERGRGILLVVAPVAGGRSSTYYALLSHAAQAGKTVYSVERSLEYEIPAVAQVLVNPGSPVGAASYLAAGMRQDTDVLAIDSMQSVEDVHLAIEAAGLGKLVIATFAGADVVAGVRRMLDLGAEPVSLASALTLGIGQRVVRLNCPSCSLDEKNPLSDRIPGAEKGMTTRRGSGCPACASTGFSGATGIFEILPFTEPVRAGIARGASAEQLAKAARAAGMRPMLTSGLAKVRDGLVSPNELDRVLRFSA